jgi:protein-tyrosine phosphatase
MTDRAQRELLRLGGDPLGFTSRELTADLVAAADLVLTGAIEHRSKVVALVPAAASRTYAMAEFGALAGAVAAPVITRESDPVRRARALVDEVRMLRGLVQVDQPDIPDPVGGSRWAYRAAGRRIARALAIPLRLLTP